MHEQTIILPVVLYGCETLSLTLSENILSRSVNRVLTSVFGPKRDEVTGGWRELHNEELHNLYSSPSIIRIIKSRRMKWAEHAARIGEKRNGYRVLVGKLEEKNKRRWVDNVKMDLRVIGWNGMDWTDLAQDRGRWRALVNTV
jgi:hypothetical protein